MTDGQGTSDATDGLVTPSLKDELYPLVQKEAAFYVPIHTSESFSTFPKNEDPKAQPDKSVRMVHALSEVEKGQIDLPDTLAEHFRFYHVTLPQDEIDQAVRTHQATAEYFETLPDFLNPYIGMPVSEKMRDVVMKHAPDAAYFAPFTLINAETGAEPEQPYFSMLPRFVIQPTRALRKRYDLGTFRADYSRARSTEYFVQAIDGASEVFGQYGLTSGTGFNRALFVALKQAGLTGLDEIPYLQEYQTAKDTIGHVYR